ncbi:hypothetical protein FRZ67_08400 [Panacibacter ginsenosidivorans]|uniref:Tetratricopeptide repeat protein n=1 Tax=Panacibacter ginsenosidivorans TaxID=1813871 RepID=A0A5B8V7B8_9BACT|nr:hypothetical protein [Panacibacter ginsenosidivorans]QEC67314.1 hypothetical protein FRZ67_08400 [Panacibacter ginsenosidivorans]
MFPAFVQVLSCRCVALLCCGNFIQLREKRKNGWVDCPNDNPKCITIKRLVFYNRKNITLRIIANSGVGSNIMTTLKFITTFLLIGLCSCEQKQTTNQTNLEVARLSRRVTPLFSYVDNVDSCKKALSFLDSATAIDSNCFLCHYNKLMFLYALKQYDRIFSTIDDCIRIKPDAHDLYLAAGILHEKVINTISSKPYFTKSLAICNSALDTMKTSNRDYVMLTTNKAINLIMLGDSAQANEILKRLYNIQPDDPEFDNGEKKYTLSLMNKSKAQLIDTLFNLEKYTR